MGTQSQTQSEVQTVTIYCTGWCSLTGMRVRRAWSCDPDAAVRWLLGMVTIEDLGLMTF